MATDPSEAGRPELLRGHDVIDAHVHVACAPDAAPRRATPLGSSSWWETEGSPADLVAALAGTGVAGAVVVQAVALYGHDCRCARAVAADLGPRFAFVGSIDVALDDPVAELDRLHEGGGLAGVRLFGVLGDQPWLVDGRGSAVFGWAAEHDVSLVATLFAASLHALGELAVAHPSVDVALDHCGFPDLAGDEGPLLALAAVPSVAVKVSSHNLSRPDAAGLVERLAGAFGVDRLCWGSDFPQHREHTYVESLALAVDATASFSPADRTAFFATTSERLWFDTDDS